MKDMMKKMPKGKMPKGMMDHEMPMKDSGRQQRDKAMKMMHGGPAHKSTAKREKMRDGYAAGGAAKKRKGC